MKTNEGPPTPELPLDVWQRLVSHLLDAGRRCRDPRDTWRWDLFRVGALCRDAYAAARPLLFRELILPIRGSFSADFPPECSAVHPDAVPFPRLHAVGLTDPLFRRIRSVTKVQQLNPLVVLDGKLYFASLARDGDTAERVQRTVTAMWSDFVHPAALSELFCLVRGGLVLVPFPTRLVSYVVLLDPQGRANELSPTIGGRRWNRLPFVRQLDPRAIRKLVFTSNAPDASSVLGSLSRMFPRASSCFIENLADESAGATVPLGATEMDYDGGSFDDHLLPAVEALVLSKYQLARLRDAGLHGVIGDPIGTARYPSDEERDSDASAEEFAGSDSDDDYDTRMRRRFGPEAPRLRAFRRVTSFTLRGIDGDLDCLEDIFMHPHIERLALLGTGKYVNVNVMSPLVVSMPSLRYLELSFICLDAIYRMQRENASHRPFEQCKDDAFPLLETLVIVNDGKCSSNLGIHSLGLGMTKFNANHLDSFAKARNLREFAVQPDDPECTTQMEMSVNDLRRLGQLFPKLERLLIPIVSAPEPHSDLGPLALSNLRELDADASVCSCLANTELPALRKVTVRGPMERIPVERWPNVAETVLHDRAEQDSEAAGERLLAELENFKKLGTWGV
ncbi:hypothetical protein H9P43_005444 [Blastocladiella emersonii ATCC 22665]|nr:hypothetical protein H9P43_005444 [Blastocladiella emersonii ATCC 22665]